MNIHVVEKQNIKLCHYASFLCSIHSSGELIGVHYVDRRRALIRWALWTGEVSYSHVSGFDICGVARYAYIQGVTRVIIVINITI